MEESEIIELFRSRNERAVEETEKLFGRKLLSTAVRILGDPEDAKECVNETLWKAWAAMPADGPEYLKAYLLKICRNEAINMLRYKNAEKRQGVILELTAEMEQSIPNRMEEAKIEARELEAGINRFLTELPEEKRKIFMRRYWFGDSVAEIAGRYGVSEEKVKTVLFRLRKKLKKFLEKEDFVI